MRVKFYAKWSFYRCKKWLYPIPSATYSSSKHSYLISIPLPFFFKLTSFASFIHESTIIITDFTYLRQIWVVFWAIYYKSFHCSFFSSFIAGMTLMIINNLPRICNFATIFPDPQMLTYWLQGLTFFFWFFWITIPTWFCQPHLVVPFYLIKFWFVFKDLTYGKYLRHTFYTS